MCHCVLIIGPVAAEHARPVSTTMPCIYITAPGQGFREKLDESDGNVPRSEARKQSGKIPSKAH